MYTAEPEYGSVVHNSCILRSCTDVLRRPNVNCLFNGFQKIYKMVRPWPTMALLFGTTFLMQTFDNCLSTSVEEEIAPPVPEGASAEWFAPSMEMQDHIVSNLALHSSHTLGESIKISGCP